MTRSRVQPLLAAVLLLGGTAVLADCGAEPAPEDPLPWATARPSAGPADTADAILWEPDLATAQAKAAESGRPVMAYFTFDT